MVSGLRRIRKAPHTLLLSSVPSPFAPLCWHSPPWVWPVRWVKPICRPRRMRIVATTAQRPAAPPPTQRLQQPVEVIMPLHARMDIQLPPHHRVSIWHPQRVTPPQVVLDTPMLPLPLTAATAHPSQRHHVSIWHHLMVATPAPLPRRLPQRMHLWQHHRVSIWHQLHRTVATLLPPIRVAATPHQ